MEQEFLTAKDVAAYLGIHISTFWRLAKREGFPPGIRLTAGIVRWQKSAIIEHLLAAAAIPPSGKKRGPKSKK